MTRADVDVVDVLISQHEQIERLLVDVIDSDDPEDAFEELQTVLKMHELGEQKVVHPVTRDLGNSSQVAEDSVQEENHADVALARAIG